MEKIESISKVFSGTSIAAALMQADVSELDVAPACQAYGVLDLVSKAVAKRIKAIKEVVRGKVSGADGLIEHTAKTVRFEFAGGYADVTTPETGAPTINQEKLEEILKARKIKKEEALDKVVSVSWSINATKLDELVGEGRLSTEDVEACLVTPEDPTPRLSVSLDKEIEKEIAKMIFGETPKKAKK
jgi:hypothetical protein